MMPKKLVKVPNIVAGWRLWLPPPQGRKHLWLNLNDRRHWGYSSSLTSYWRATAYKHALGLGVSAPLGSAYVVASFTFGDNRRRDVHNFMPTVKACIDGCTDAGLWVDDRDGILLGPDVRRREVPGSELVGLGLEVCEVDGYVFFDGQVSGGTRNVCEVCEAGLPVVSVSVP